MHRTFGLSKLHRFCVDGHAIDEVVNAIKYVRSDEYEYNEFRKLTSFVFGRDV